MVVSIVLFAIAAVGGLTMAVMRLRGRDLPPIGLALLHGLVAAVALILLIVAVVGASAGSAAASTAAIVALVGFIVAALGGFFVFSFHLRKKALPIPPMIVHALVAVASFLVLLVVVLRMR